MGRYFLENDSLEVFWEQILSRNPDLILSAFFSIPPGEQKKCFAHLKKMTTETGWHSEQVQSAQIALDTLQ